MATLSQTTQFIVYELTEQEQLCGTILTLEQKMLIKNEISQISANRLALVPDPLNYSVFIQEEAFLKGQISSLQYLLDCSSASEQAVIPQQV